MDHRSQPRQRGERRALVLAVPDALDTAIALHSLGHEDFPHFLSCAGAVDGAAECTSCGEFELVTAGHDAAVTYRPTHLVVRDGSGDSEDVARCRLFLEGALAGGASTVRCVIQTHPRPGTPSTKSYDAWLKRGAGIRGDCALDIVWHDPLTTTFLDCRGETQQVDDALAWQYVNGPARTIARRLRDASPHNLEYTATRNL